MNFLRGIVGSQDGAPAVRIGATTLRLDPSVVASRPGLAAFTGREIVVGIRPEAFEAAARVPTGEARSQTLRVRIDVVEQLGAEAFVHFALDVPPVTTRDVRELLEDEAGEVALARATTQVTARVDPDLAPPAGATADLFVDTTKLHFFHPDSGLAIT